MIGSWPTLSIQDVNGKDLLKMPLGAQRLKAYTVIHKLEQPHRFAYAMNTQDGFQHHGFELDDVVGFARKRIAARFGIPANEVDDFITVGPPEFTTPGGMDYDQVMTRLSAWLAANPQASPKQEDEVFKPSVASEALQESFKAGGAKEIGNTNEVESLDIPDPIKIEEPKETVNKPASLEKAPPATPAQSAKDRIAAIVAAAKQVQSGGVKK
jgi:hypothetical protein